MAQSIVTRRALDVIRTTLGGRVANDLVLPSGHNNPLLSEPDGHSQMTFQTMILSFRSLNGSGGTVR